MNTNKYFDLSPHKTGIFVASGDDGWNNAGAGASGSGPDFPSTSELVIAVGGTSLTKSAIVDTRLDRDGVVGRRQLVQPGDRDADVAEGHLDLVQLPRGVRRRRGRRSRDRRQHDLRRLAGGGRRHQRGVAVRRRGVRALRPRPEQGRLRLHQQDRVERRHLRLERHVRQHHVQRAGRLGRPDRPRHAKRQGARRDRAQRRHHAARHGDAAGHGDAARHGGRDRQRTAAAAAARAAPAPAATAARAAPAPAATVARATATTAATAAARWAAPRARPAASGSSSSSAWPCSAVGSASDSARSFVARPRFSL